MDCKYCNWFNDIENNCTCPVDHEEHCSPDVNEFVKLYPESGDWEALYLNGKLIAEGHSVRVSDVLDAIANVFPNTYKSIEVSDERAEMGFDKNLSDIIVEKL